jgi:NAD(P)H-dependent flavin oxidoreductase YrpB (nitropropane dioxygenase family)
MAQRFAELLAAGAAAVAVGTRFIAAQESDAHPLHVELLIGALREDTVLAECFVIGWPNAPHRVLRSAVENAGRLHRRVAGVTGDQEVLRLGPLPPKRQTRGDVAAMALYAGESVDYVTRIQPAGEIVAELTATLSS